MQKFKIPLLISGVIVLAAVAYYFFSSSSGVYQAIPKSTVAVLEVKDWLQFADKLNTTSIGSELKKTEAQKKLSDLLLVIQDLLSKDKALKEEITSGKTVASVHLISADSYDFLITTELKGVNDNTILNRVQASPNIRSVKVRIFKHQKIVDVMLKDGRQISFAKLKDVLAFSFTTFLTENAITSMLTGDNLSRDKGFKSVYAKGIGNADMAFYFNLAKADIILPVAFKAEKISLLNDLKEAGSWARYEISFSNDKMECNGTIAREKNTKTIIEEEKSIEEIIGSKIPDNAAYVDISTRASADTSANQMLNQYFSGWVGQSKASIILEPLKENFSEQNLFIITITDPGKAIKSLKELIAADGTQPYPMDTFLMQEIYMLKSGELINQVFPNSLIGFKSCYFSVQNDAAIFCNNADVLKMVLEKIYKKETLNNDKNYLSATLEKSKTDNHLHYLNIHRSDLLLKGMLKENSSLSDFLLSFKYIAESSSAKDNKLTSHLVFNTLGEKVVSAGLLWKTKLQTVADFVPQVLKNPEGGNEIFVQDTDNNIYLLNESGGIVFSRNTEEPVLGKVEQLDYYNNGHHQLIFNTTNRVFIIDRMGNDVASYPLRLSATASCGMTLTSGDILNPYRYYIPCTNGCIYGFSANGKPLSGWSPKTNAGIVTQPIQCFTSNKNSYVLTFNNVGKLTLFDSKGQVKWNADNLPAANQNYSLLKTNGDFTLLNSSNNQLTEISFDGNDNIKPLMDTAYSFVALTTSDSTYSYFYSSNNQIRSYNNLGEFLCSASATEGSVLKIDLIRMGEKNYLQAADEANGTTLIYDLSLKSVREFKINPFTKFLLSDFLNRGEWVEIAPDDKGNLCCYRLK